MRNYTTIGGDGWLQVVEGYLTSCSSGGDGRMIVEPLLPAAGSLPPVIFTSPALDDERDVIPKKAAGTYEHPHAIVHSLLYFKVLVTN